MTTKTTILDVADSKAISTTIGIIAEAIKTASLYAPLRNHAAAIAARAPRHDYMGQLSEIWKDTLQHWRYVRDPVFAETMAVSPDQIMQLTLGFADSGRGLGIGDCDDITIALGAMLSAIGFPVRIVTSSETDSPQWSHVFIQADVPGRGWVTLDPVLYPAFNLGDTIPAARLGYWTIDNRPHIAPAAPLLGDPTIELNHADISVFGDRIVGDIEHLGAYTDPGVSVELGPRDYTNGHGIPPLLYAHPIDMQRMNTRGAPFPGMRALGSTGYIYEYTETPGHLGGPFRRLFRRIGNAIKGAVQSVWGVVERVFQATKFGRWILRVKDRVLDLAVRVVGPLAQKLQKWAPALAPLTAVIPGIGPYVAMVLAEVGAVSAAFVKWGIPIIKVIQTIDGQNVELTIPNFETEEQYQAFAQELEAAAQVYQNLPAEEIEAMAIAAAQRLGPPNPENPWNFSDEQLAAARAAELERARAAASNAAHAAQRSIEAVAQRRAQAAEAARRYQLTNNPETQRAIAQAQAAAWANQEQAQAAAQAAQWAARATESEFIAAQARAVAEMARNDPAYRARKRDQALFTLRAAGFAPSFA